MPTSIKNKTAPAQTEKKVYIVPAFRASYASGLQAYEAQYHRYNLLAAADAEGFTHAKIGASTLRIDTAIRNAWTQGGTQYASHLRGKVLEAERAAELEARFAPYREWLDEQRVNMKGVRGLVELSFRKESEHYGHKSKATLYGPFAVTLKNSLRGQQIIHARSGLQLPGCLEGDDILRYLWLLINSGIDWEFDGLADHVSGTGRKATDIATRLQSKTAPVGWTPETKDFYTLRDGKFYVEVVAPGLDRVVAFLQGDEATYVRDKVTRYKTFEALGDYPSRIFRSAAEQLSCFLCDYDDGTC